MFWLYMYVNRLNFYSGKSIKSLKTKAQYCQSFHIKFNHEWIFPRSFSKVTCVYCYDISRHIKISCSGQNRSLISFISIQYYCEWSQVKVQPRAHAVDHWYVYHGIVFSRQFFLLDCYKKYNIQVSFFTWIVRKLILCN